MFLFLTNSILLGVGLAMDAFSVSIANGLREPHMKLPRMSGIAGVYAFFQFLMPVIGWVCVTFFLSIFTAFQKFIPWIALILLLYIGGKMLIEGIGQIRENRKGEDGAEDPDAGSTAGAATETASASTAAETAYKVGFGTLIVQGIATSIDALSVGFTIADYNLGQALGASIIIALVTFAICMVGLRFGKKFGERLADKATVFGGIILIIIGLEIFIRGVM